MTIERKNFSGNNRPPKDFRYVKCNFSQPNPNTRLWPGDDTSRTFVECNLVNCVPPPGSTLDLCNTTQIERQVEVGTEDITHGQRTVRIKRYINRILGKLNPNTLQFESKQSDVDTDPPTGTSQTNSSGEVTFLLDAGLTYYLWMRKDGIKSINGQSFVAVAD